jgi:uncharacterized protein YndB with AHSA1/START domain
MAEIQQSVYIQAPPSRVYDALVKCEQLSQWWTQCQTESREGGEARFEFDEGNYAHFKIQKLVAPKKVIWFCCGHNFNGNHDFEGTTIEFTLTPTTGGTHVNFLHRDWQKDSGVFELCRIGWDHFVTVSLKSFVERGQGQPHDQAAPLIMERAIREGKLRPPVAAAST